MILPRTKFAPTIIQNSNYPTLSIHRHLFHFFFLLTFGILIFSCTKKQSEYSYYQEDGASIFKDSLYLKEDKIYLLPIDSKTPLSSNSVQLSHLAFRKGDHYLSCINNQNRTLDIYDYDTKEIVKKVYLSNEGPNSLGNTQYLTHFIINKDSIIITNSWTQFIFLIDSNGNILNKQKLPDPDFEKLIGGVDVDTKSPIHLIKDHIYIQTNLVCWPKNDFKALKHIIKLGKDLTIKDRFLSRPELYNNGTWSGYQFNLHGTFNPLKNTLLYSFAADPYIHEVDLSGRLVNKHYNSSKFFKEIRPYSEERYESKKINSIISEIEKNDFLQPLYGNLIYDKYNNVYYRFAYLPQTEEELLDPDKKKYRKETIIILDSNFKKVGETLLDNKKYNTDMFFLSEKGLHISHLAEIHKDENEMEYSIFKLTAK